MNARERLKAELAVVRPMMTNPLDVHEFSVKWLLREIDKFEARLRKIESVTVGDGK